MGKNALPDLSRFEISCLRRLWSHGEASVRDILEDLPNPPSYSTVKKIFERLEEKGAVERVGMDGKAVIYRSVVSSRAMIRKEVGRLLEMLFDGAGAPLLAHLFDMNAVTLEDLREIDDRFSLDRDVNPERHESHAEARSQPRWESHGSS